MVRLEYFNGKEWIFVGSFHSDLIAWLSLGGDDLNYRTVGADGNVMAQKGGN